MARIRSLTKFIVFKNLSFVAYAYNYSNFAKDKVHSDDMFDAPIFRCSKLIK